MAAPNIQDLWVQLQRTAWEEANGSRRGWQMFERGARNRWAALNAAAQTSMGNALINWHTADEGLENSRIPYLRNAPREDTEQYLEAQRVRPALRRALITTIRALLVERRLHHPGDRSTDRDARYLLSLIHESSNQLTFEDIRSSGLDAWRAAVDQFRAQSNRLAAMARPQTDDLLAVELDPLNLYINGVEQHEAAARAVSSETFDIAEDRSDRIENGTARDAADQEMKNQASNLYHLDQLYNAIIEQQETLANDLRDRRDRADALQHAIRQGETDPLATPGAWFGGYDLGAGGHGSACVHVKIGEKGTVVDRVAQKDATDHNPNSSRGQSVWLPAGDKPLEVAVMYRLRGLKGSSSIVQIRNWKRRDPAEDGKKQFRIFMEYCGYGDLFKLKRAYYHNNDEKIPLPFLWAIMESLATAGLLMEQGQLEDNYDPDMTTWGQIVHGDMKYDNVFLGENDSDSFRIFPKPKLGDFGIAFVHPIRPDVGDGTDWVAFGGNEWGAPEHTRPGRRHRPGYDPHDPTQNDYIPDTMANVWGVGFILYSMLADNNPHSSRNGLKDRPYQIRKLSDQVKAKYEDDVDGPSLIVLIEHCLEPLPHDCPSFSEILDVVQGRIGVLRGLRLAEADNPGYVGHKMDFNDTYRLGLARLAVPGMNPNDQDGLDPARGSPGAHVVAARLEDDMIATGGLGGLPRV